MKSLIGTKQVYNGKLKPYVGLQCEVLLQWTSGLCKGRYQVLFLQPVLDTDGVELDDSLTVAAEDLIR